VISDVPAFSTIRSQMAPLVAMLVAAAVGLNPALGTAAEKSAYPTKPIRLIIPFALGNTADLVARLFAPPCSGAPSASGHHSSCRVTSAAVIHKLHVGFAQVAFTPDVNDQLERNGAEVLTSISNVRMLKRIRAETRKFSAVVKTADISIIR
jgi:tripartite-type tricarboxylate transporter receptor subunit TctC